MRLWQLQLSIILAAALGFWALSLFADIAVQMQTPDNVAKACRPGTPKDAIMSGLCRDWGFGNDKGRPKAP